MKRASKLFGVLAMMGIGLAGAAVTASAASDWADLVKVYGDLRYRVESFQAESSSLVTSYRDRQRIRARVGILATADDYWTGNIRLTTDEFKGLGADPTSGNQTLTDDFDKKGFYLDLASIEYRVLFNNLKLIGGKMLNPFEIVGKSEMIWDADLTLEGMAAQGKYEVMPDTNAFVNVGGFWPREIAAGYDPMLYGAQIGVKTKVEDVKLTGGISYYYYTDIKNQYAYDYTLISGNTLSATSYGNSLNKGMYANNFMLGEGFLEANGAVMSLPVKGYLSWVLNNGANEWNRAYIYGLVFNKADKEGSWEVGANYRVVWKDAVLGAFCDSDFNGGGTNAEGYKLHGSYALADNAKVSLAFFRNRKDLDKTIKPYYNRFQADVVLNF